MFSNLQLDNYFVPELSIKANPDFSPKSESRVAEIGIERTVRRHSKDPARYYLELKVKVYPGEGEKKRICPICAEITTRGYFRFIEIPKDEKEIAKFIMLNGAAILYGLVRAHVAQITSLGPYGRFILPAVNFLEISKEESRKKN